MMNFDREQDNMSGDGLSRNRKGMRKNRSKIDRRETKLKN